METLSVGMFVRTKRDGIGRIISLSIGEEDECCFIELSNRRTGIKEHNISKASYNIIDLIEVGDYVNGNKIIKISTDHCGRNILIYGYDDGDRQVVITIYEDEIKSIVTKEQFEQMKYKVGV